MGFPAQGDDVAWPTDEWPVDEPDGDVDAARLAALLDRAFADPQPHDLAVTRALVVVHRGVIVAERYGPDTTSNTPLRSWSMAKSVLATLVGILVDAGRLDPDRPAAVPEWQGEGDLRRDITLGDLLRMRSGLAWREDYVDAAASDVQEMLFGSGRGDMAAFAAAQPLAHPPGTVTHYSSGTSNIVSRIVADVVAGTAATPADRTAAYDTWARAVLFDPIGMQTASPRYDDAGTWIGSSYLWATARDWARFGLLHLRGGAWGDRQVVSEEWVRTEATASGVDEDGDVYGAHWWVQADPPGTFVANGHDHQRVRVVPARDLVVVRLGRTPTERGPHVTAWLDEITGCFPDVAGPAA